MSAMEFFQNYGEAARIVRQIGGSADENARRVYDLYRRHAQDVIGVADAALSQHASQIRTRSLPESCLLRLVHDPSVPTEWGATAALTSAVVTQPAADEYVLHHRGEG